jgi:heat shock protein HtpX
MATIYTHIDRNKRLTWVIMALFILIVGFVGWFVGEFFFEGAGIPFVGIALIFSGITTFISYYNSDKIVLAITGAKEVKYEENPQLHNLVDNMCIASGLPKPGVYMIQDPAMNAFATGRDPKNSVVCFTSGLVNNLEKTELEGVVAHELSHIQNYDIRLMSIVSILVGTIALMADLFLRGMFFGGGRDRRSGGNPIILVLGLLFVILSPIIATIIKLAVSRKREFLADSSAALMTRYPRGLANALAKISKDPNVLKKANSATAHMFISNPLKDGKGGSWAKLFNTHPPVDERINRLLSM